MKQYSYFNELPLKALFVLHGNEYRKESSRTAHLLEYDRRFYIGKRDLCIVGKYSRLSEDYHK